MAATPTRPAYWGVTNNRAVLPVDGYQSTLPEFSLASQPVSTQVSSTGEPLVAWVENLTSQGVVQRAVPYAGANGVQSYQAFIGDVYSNQRIAYSYKNARGEWETNPLYYIPADGAIIQNLQVVNTTPVGAGSPQVLMVWTETSIEAMQGLKPQLSSLQNGFIPTVIKSAQFDPQNARFSTPEVVPWDPSTEVGLGVTDPKGIFGTTLGLEKKFGGRRVLDMPAAENGMTGIAIGSALVDAAAATAPLAVDVRGAAVALQLVRPPFVPLGRT
jgi:hypothetical protein